jgi:hypothetical protein
VVEADTAAPPSPAARPRGRGALLALVAAFAATRLVARLGFGLRFDADTLYYWHLLDPGILREDLLRGLLYLHSQPPLYNLAVGLVLKGVPEAYAARAFEAAFLALGFLAIAGIHALLVELGTPPRAALVLALLQTLSTTWLVYESWLFYTLPVAVLVTWAAVFLARAARGSARAASSFAAAVVALSWTRASFHPAWAALALALLIVAVRGSGNVVRARALRAALAAMALVLALPAKNALLVGAFASSSWLGLNLAHMTTERLDEATREQWVREGAISPVARVPSFSPLSSFPERLRVAPPGTPDHPALVAPAKADGTPNFNHAAYVGIAREYQQAARLVVARRPDVYLERVRRAFRTWLRPPTDYILVVPQREAVRDWDRLHSRLLLWASLERRRAGPSWVLLPAALLFLLAFVRRDAGERRRLLLLSAFPLLTIAWNAGAGNLLDVEENNRFRVEVEGLVVALGSFGLADAACRAAAFVRPRPLC